MITKRFKFMLASVVVLVALTSVIPRSVYEIKNISLVGEAQAQQGGGIMQNIMPLLMLMMMMNMMQQNKGNQLQREQADAAKNANSNLMRADTQPNGGEGAPGINPVTNPVKNPGTNPLTDPNANPFGMFVPR